MIVMTRAFVTLALVLSPLALSQSTQPPQSAPQAAEKGAIDGMVLDNRSGLPLKRATIMLRSTRTGKAQAAEVDENGKFIMEDVEEGVYSLQAIRDGYLTANWGRHGGVRLGRQFALRAGQSIRDVTFRLDPFSVIEGRVRYFDGEPAHGIPVTIYRRRFELGRLRLVEAGATRTNDRGEYRVAGLEPGAYLIAAIYDRPLKPIVDNVNDLLDVPAVEQSYSTTFFPSGRQLSEAVSVPLGIGEERRGMDLYLTPTKAYRVRVEVADSCTGRPNARAVLQLYRADANEAGSPGGALLINPDIRGHDGVFVIRGLIPGSYFLAASADPPPDCLGPLRDSRLITLAEAPQDHNLMLQAATEMRLEVATDDGKPIEPSAYGIRLRPRPAATSILSTTWRPQRGFFSANVEQGRLYDLLIDRKPADYYVKSVDAVLAPYARIAFGTQFGQLAGALRNEKQEPVPGAAIRLIPDPGSYLHMVETYTDDLGIFVARGLAPGNYLVVPYLDTPPCEVDDLADRTSCRQIGTRVTIERDQRKSIELFITQF